jgi:hypothetical protein
MLGIALYTVKTAESLNGRSRCSKVVVMKTWSLVPLLALLVSPCQAVEIAFDKASTFDKDFPAIALTGGNSSASIQTGHVALRGAQASGDGTTSGQASAYSASRYSSDLDFISSSKTFVFNGAALTFSTPGTTYQGNFGVVSGTGGGLSQISGPDDGVYFRIDRSSRQLLLMQKRNGTNSTLGQWPIADNVYSFKSLSLTLSAAKWSVSGESTSGSTVVSGSGTFSSPWDTASWGTKFRLALQGYQTVNDPSRFAELQMTGLSVNPAR